MLEFQNASIYRREKRILDDFNLTVPDGAIMGLVGSDSKAKSMILRRPAEARLPITGRFCWMASLFIRREAGHIRISDICPGSTGFYDLLRVDEYFELFLSLYKVNGRYRQKRMEEVRNCLASASI